jgi:hypothetical protein
MGVPVAYLDDVEWRKILAYARNRTLTVQPVALRHAEFVILFLE